MSYYYRKMWIGLLVNIVFGSVGPVWWGIAMDSVSGMAKSLKPWAILVFAGACIPAIILYVLWYNKGVRAIQKLNTKSKPGFVMYLVIGLVCIFGIALGLGFVFFAKALKYAIISAVFAAVGSVVAYLVGKP